MHQEMFITVFTQSCLQKTAKNPSVSRMAGLRFIHIMECSVTVKTNDLKPNISTRMHLTSDVRGSSKS